MDTNLPEDKRKQLDDIVQKMVANKESDTSIRFVVDDFKKKYTPVVQPQLTAPKKTFLESAGTVANTLFPGKKVGEAIGTLGGLVKANFDGTSEFYDTSAPKPLQVAGDIGAGALTVAAPGIGGSSVGARIGANAALGAGIGTTQAISEGDSVGKVAGSAALGGVAGGVLSGAAEGLNALATNAPKWFTKLALPKLKDIPESKFIANKAGGYTATSQDIIDYTLKNTKIGSLKSIYNKSTSTANKYSSEISKILENKPVTGNVNQAINTVLSDFPEAQLDAKKVANIVKQVAPGTKNIVEKVANGTATLKEQNLLRQELDMATKKAYGDNPALTFNKQIGKKLADFLRNNVQTTAPETAPLFNDLSKELNLNNAILQAAKKRRVLGDLIAGGAGFAGGGIKGAAAAIALERTVRSPAALLAGAKAIRAAGKAKPVVNTIGKAVKTPLLRVITK